MRAYRVDFTGTCTENFKEFDQKVIDLLRSHKPKTIIVTDYGFALPTDEPCLVSDHLNFTGTSPLCGPNHPCGERFPVVNNIYDTDFGPKAKKGVVAGLKHGVTPDSSELELMKKLGADFYSYNLVQTMLVAAHAGHKVIGVLLPKGASEEMIEEFVKNLCDVEQ